ncbi:FAD-binding protein [Kocuria coralli]|uniref:FAD-binding protein n=1 Tax=Kocuria coralli TaxID=1461025 RepID=A0A5J5KZJ0_9MICC|nr:FAD-linked oxidase C-terminal domain-containing protein [Kocuria coralli]KAA9394818.1 FAD-binding protein [Kocuria coralli]
MGVVQTLLDALGEDVVTTAPDRLEAMRTDRSGWVAEGSPLALVEARTVEEVQEAMRIADAARTPVVPRGAGTGLAGGAVGTEGSIVVSVERMNRILEISAEDEYAVVEPGVITADLNRALEEHGLWYAPDPVSKNISTIGGNIATNAGGLVCTKYGVTREAVLALDVVLPGGTLLRTGRRTIKGVTGYDLTALFVGSEGTLGIVVGATVRALPAPKGETMTLGALFSDVKAAASASAAITAAGLRPSVMELIDAATLNLIRDYLGHEVFENLLGTSAGGSYFLVQFDAGTGALAGTRALQLVEENGGTGTLSHDPAEAEGLLRIRGSANPALTAAGTMLVEDVAVPRSRMPEMFARIEEIARRHDVRIPTIAHAGDGNLHPTFIFDGPDVPPEVWAAADEMFEASTEFGGTLTGEHGVGLLKRRWLKGELGEDSYRLQAEVKAVFDPNGIMNPGKVFD